MSSMIMSIDVANKPTNNLCNMSHTKPMLSNAIQDCTIIITSINYFVSAKGYDMFECSNEGYEKCVPS